MKKATHEWDYSIRRTVFAPQMIVIKTFDSDKQFQRKITPWIAVVVKLR